MKFKDLISKKDGNASAAIFDLISHEDWQLVLMECKMWPGIAKQWKLVEGFFDGEHDSRVLPIHLSCALQCPPQVIDTLVESYPVCIRLREETFQRLPLHVACQTNAPVETVEAILRCYPEGARAKDSIGRLPIHYACSHNADSAVIDLLLHEFPASAGCGDSNGWLPIHVACRRGAHIYVVQRLLDCLPCSAEIATNKGSTPMMCVKKGGSSQNHLNLMDFLESYIQRESAGNKKEIAKEGLAPTGFPRTSTVRHRQVNARVA